MKKHLDKFKIFLVILFSIFLFTSKKAFGNVNEDSIKIIKFTSSYDSISLTKLDSLKIFFDVRNTAMNTITVFKSALIGDYNSPNVDYRLFIYRYTEGKRKHQTSTKKVIDIDYMKYWMEKTDLKPGKVVSYEFIFNTLFVIEEVGVYLLEIEYNNGKEDIRTQPIRIVVSR